MIATNAGGHHPNRFSTDSTELARTGSQQMAYGSVPPLPDAAPALTVSTAARRRGPAAAIVALLGLLLAVIGVAYVSRASTSLRSEMKTQEDTLKNSTLETRVEKVSNLQELNNNQTGLTETDKNGEGDGAYGSDGHSQGPGPPPTRSQVINDAREQCAPRAFLSVFQACFVAAVADGSVRGRRRGAAC